MESCGASFTHSSSVFTRVTVISAGLTSVFVVGVLVRLTGCVWLHTGSSDVKLAGWANTLPLRAKDEGSVTSVAFW